VLASGISARPLIFAVREGVVMSFEQLRDEIAVRVDGGDDLAAIESALTTSSVRRLGEDERAALWVFAWSYRERRNRRLSHFRPAIASFTALDAYLDGLAEAGHGGRRRVAHAARQRAPKRAAPPQYPRAVDSQFRTMLGRTGTSEQGCADLDTGDHERPAVTVREGRLVPESDGPTTGGPMSQKANVATSAQRLRALQQANHVRHVRAVLKAHVAEGQITAAEVILACPPEANGMPIAQLLATQRGWGHARSAAFLAEVSVSDKKPIGSLTKRQRRNIASMLSRATPRAPAR
jgi:hypothetical protein